ncbi:NAD(P)/FAD-dependent oxidoreductase [Marinicella meishanensis]|uniref:NAD(P)/FAD-dependent oxidoreductase n=1 Tax=Marinicella meishanensis TaxID=2873263 RepID=UPI001CBCCB7A|nr:NAD(P)/FAD-dependent oxidoreductase [Marinicella sp. NBU2979]
MNTEPAFDVIILGAGAAGMMCALTAGQQGLRVLLLEKSNKPGKKILMSGGGRCNFTNLHTAPENFISANPHFCKSALSRYTPWHFIELVARHDIPYHEKELGQLFCDRSSKDIVNMLLDECAAGGVELRLNVAVVDLVVGAQIKVTTDQGTFHADHLVVATGGLSIPKMGGSDFGYQLAERLGLSILPKRAALVPFIFTDQHKALFAALSGSAIAVSVSVPDQSTAPTFQHQMLFTHRGLSGPAMLQISSYWQQGHALCIDLLPGIEVLAELTASKSHAPNQTLVQWLSHHWPKKVAEALLTWQFPDWAVRSLQALNQQQLQLVANWLGGWLLKPSGTEGYRTAEVTLGGVDTTALSSKTMACQTQPNVYFIGEVVDVTGHLGGFNFQWAWASGHAAGQALLESKRS